MFTTYSLIMAQVEFGIISIVGKNVVESELKLQIFLQFLMYHNFLVQFLTYYNFFYKMAVIQYFDLLLHTPIILKIIPA